jgi:hypothetical protein
MSALDRSTLEAAMRGLEAQRERLDGYIADVRRMLRSTPTGRGPGRPPRAQSESESQPEAPAAPARKQRRFSPAVRKRLAEAMRQRWAVKRTAAQAAAKKRATKKGVKSSQVFGRKTLNSSAPRKRGAAKKAAAAAAASGQQGMS